MFFSLIIILPTRVEANIITASSNNRDIVSFFSEMANEEGVEVSLENSRSLIEEPLIRVGLLKTKDTVKFKSEIDYKIYSGDELIGLLLAGEEAKISYRNGQYFLISDNWSLESEKFWRLIPTVDSGIFELPECKRTINGRKMFFCSYRGVLEYRYGKLSKMPYLINELLLEDYMKGITETDNNSAEGYIKAVLVAARSYAFKNISFEPPTDKRVFDVFASTQDQLYLGYISEKTMPRVAKFAQETIGEMVTYDSNVVTTPYFTRTSGATKNWKNYQGVKNRPWLVSVKCIYDKGRSKAGHGYGMSTHDALMRATKDDWDYMRLLKYYYSSTEIEKIY